MAERIGALFALRDDLDLVTRAERLGYESVWAAEGQGKTAFGKLERWAGVTEEIGLATGIVNTFSRTPATLAQAIATLDAHSGGRAILGLGVAHPGVVESFHGMSYERPLTRLREYIRLVRRYLAGDATGFEGECYSPERTAFWDAFEPVRSDIPIYNAALGPENVRLTGELADGWLPNLYPTDRLQRARDWLADGASAGGRSVADIDTAMYVLAAIDPEISVARQMASEHIAYYLRDIPGFYDRVARNAGYEESVAAIQEAPTTAAAADAVPAELIDRFAIVGSPESGRARLDDLRQAGVDLPIVRAPAGADAETVQRTIETFAPA